MRTLDLNEAAAFLHIHPHTLEAKARAGEIPGAKPGKCWVFLDVDLADYLRSLYAGREKKGTAVPSAGPVARKSAGTAAIKLDRLLRKKVSN